MAKKSMFNNKELNEDFDLSEIEESFYAPEEAAVLMENIIKASHHHLSIALELTKLIVGKTPGDMSEKDILLAFKNASKSIQESLPMKDFWEQFD